MSKVGTISYLAGYECSCVDGLALREEERVIFARCLLGLEELKSRGRLVHLETDSHR